MASLAKAVTLEKEEINALTFSQANLTKQLKQVMEQLAKILAAITNTKMGMGTMASGGRAPNQGMRVSVSNANPTHQVGRR